MMPTSDSHLLAAAAFEVRPQLELVLVLDLSGLVVVVVVVEEFRAGGSRLGRGRLRRSPAVAVVAAVVDIVAVVEEDFAVLGAFFERQGRLDGVLAGLERLVALAQRAHALLVVGLLFRVTFQNDRRFRLLLPRFHHRRRRSLGLLSHHRGRLDGSTKKKKP